MVRKSEIEAIDKIEYLPSAYFIFIHNMALLGRIYLWRTATKYQFDNQHHYLES